MPLTGPVYPRGSEWRKWDLHVHSPVTKLGNAWGRMEDERWDAFLAWVKEGRLAVIAVCDYFGCDCFSKLEEERKAGRLGTVEMVVPNVEFRLNETNKDGEPVNVHVLLNPVLGEEAVRRLLLNVQQFSKNQDGTRRVCSEPDLLATGYDKAQVALDDLLNALKCNFTTRDYLVVGLLNGYGNIRSDSAEGRSAERMDQIDMRCHLFFGTEANREYALRTTRFSGALPKPVLLCSDAHGPESDHDRFSWIKADPTFEGLRQILYEPDERVRLQPTNPQKFDRSSVMTSVSISNSNGWFQDGREVPLNESLVGIIGGKGTGKTALLDFVALATGSYEEKPDSFLGSASELLKDCSVKVQWGDGEVQTAKVGTPLAAEATTRYLSQGFVREKCDPGNTAQLQEQIESVIYQNLPDVDSAAFPDFESLKNARLSVVSDAKDRLTAELRAANETVAVASMGARALPQMRKAIVDTEKAIAKLDEERTAVVQSVGKEVETKKLLGELKELTESKSTAVQKASGMQASVTKADRVLAELKAFCRDNEKFVARLRETLDELEVDRETVAALRFSLEPKDLEVILAAKKATIQAAIKKARADVEQLDDRMAAANKKLGADKAVRTKIEDINKRISSLKNQLHSQNEQETQTKIAATRLPAQIKRRRELYCDYFDLLRQEKAELQRIYAPIEGKLKENGSDTSVFSFSVQFTADVDSMAEGGDVLVDHTVNGPLRQRSVETLRQFIGAKLPTPSLEGEELSVGDKKAVLDFVDAIESFFKTDKSGSFLSVAAQMRSGIEDDFYSWLFCPDYYSVTYSISFRGIELENLSPGLKGAALLILYLELDAKDQRPILIDQPEENLDNRTVYETLRGYFRAAKSRRQVLVVTHNPNLVVNTDAEQTIVANFCKDTKIQPTTICYVSGALENTFTDSGAAHPLEKQGIRDHICQVLEGGREAFEKREKKYGFS